MLPWSHLSAGLHEDFLWDDYEASLAAGHTHVPWLRLLGLLLLVLVVGLAAGAAAVLMTLRAPLIAALRRE